MKRRSFLTIAPMAAAMASLLPAAALAGDFVNYEPGMIKTALDEGKTVFVDYSATWCSTCARQARVIEALRTANPSYDSAMMFIKVDWDTYKSHEVTTGRQIPRRSTLILLKGEEELGRIVAGTAKGEIKGLMDQAL